MQRNRVVLVDEWDVSIGSMEKLAAHKEGRLHRAFSIFVFNSKGELLIQKRAAHKYHCGGLWSNTCCSHPQPEETDITSAAEERLFEEMGITCKLLEVFWFIYKTHFDNGLTEHELDHVLVGRSNDVPTPNPEEADDWKWMAPMKIIEDMKLKPELYTPWFRLCLGEVLLKLTENEKETAG